MLTAVAFQSFYVRLSKIKLCLVGVKGRKLQSVVTTVFSSGFALEMDCTIFFENPCLPRLLFGCFTSVCLKIYVVFSWRKKGESCSLLQAQSFLRFALEIRYTTFFL